jgi:hypothetical protein
MIGSPRYLSSLLVATSFKGLGGWEILTVASDDKEFVVFVQVMLGYVGEGSDDLLFWG